VHIEPVFDSAYSEVVVSEPNEPEVRHVWVKGHGQYAAPQPGLVISWQHSPVHKITDSSWTALVLVSPFDGAVLVEWVNADRLVPVSDSTPADGP
jgi:hypothetical protein